MTQKAIIVSAPSGAGKSTLVRHLMDNLPQLAFSVSACTRRARQGEIEGREYYFLPVERFREHIEACDFIEWEEVYPGSFYGTLKSEIRRIWSSDKIPVFDVDVMGGLNLKKYFRRLGLAIFIQPPSLEVLKMRLKDRATESAESLARRIAKAEQELTFASKFDTIVVNDDLEHTKERVLKLATSFIE
ncbi:MAG: guanylate kinase [Bacteroidales bacterium]|jgi:guanylate kinase|nr:guanylate kinase [Bacteroidales bacterium]